MPGTGQFNICKSMWYPTSTKEKTKANRCKKALDKIQHPFIIKTHQNRCRGNIFQHNKSYLWQNYRQRNSPQWKSKSLTAKFWTSTSMSTLITSLRQSIGNPSHSHQTRIRKHIQTGREEVKLSLYVDDTIVYIKNPEDSTQKQLEKMNSAG